VDNSTDAIQIALERDHPNWLVWTIHLAVGGVLWCARPWAAADDATQSISAESAEELAEKMEAAETA
jgi:hypothetical protein